MARIIGEVRPQYAFIENSPMLTLRGLDTVLCDLAEMGFDANWGVVSAADVGAPHRRDRIWIVAHANSAQRQGNECAEREQPTHADIGGGGWWSSEPNVGRVANGVASRVDRLKAIGNGQVPAVAAAAFQLLSEGL